MTAIHGNKEVKLTAADILRTVMPKTRGWTGRKCPRCCGTGMIDGRENEISCPSCAGTGEEYV